MATVYVVDDDRSVRESILNLAENAGLKGVGFETAEELLVSQQPLERPCCVLLDVVLGGMNGLELQERLQKRDVSLPVVLLSAYADVSMAVRAMEAGALTVIEKPCSDDLLAKAINTAIEWDRQQVEVVALLEDVESREASLSEREKIVLESVLDGRPNKAIANALDVSERTIEGDRAKILRKFNTGNAVELAARYSEYRVLSGRRFRAEQAGAPLRPTPPRIHLPDATQA